MQETLKVKTLHFHILNLFTLSDFSHSIRIGLINHIAVTEYSVIIKIAIQFTFDFRATSTSNLHLTPLLKLMHQRLEILANQTK